MPAWPPEALLRRSSGRSDTLINSIGVRRTRSFPWSEWRSPTQRDATKRGSKPSRLLLPRTMLFGPAAWLRWLGEPPAEPVRTHRLRDP